MAATITESARKLLDERYLSGGETVRGMFARAGGGNEEYVSLMEDLLFLPNSPTLFNRGKNNGCTSSACFVFDVDDCMTRNDDGTFNPNSIVGTRWKAVEVARAGGGVGYYFGNLRQRGALIKSVHRVACGPVRVLRDFHAVSALITQGGLRELAQMGVLPVWHPDIREWIHCKDEDPQGLGSFNISCSWFEEQLKECWGGDGSATPLPNKWGDLWNEQVESAWKHGCPGMLFPDTINKFNPNIHLGYINATNPCGETPNRNNEPCNLGSLALSRFFFKGNRSVDWNRLEEAVRTATRFLDDILDHNIFPHPDITAAAMLTRKLGLGVMGWSKLLALCHVHYDSWDAVNLGRRIMKLIREVSEDESEKMGKEKGPYKGFSETKTQHRMRRNETTTSIAPTGSIAILADLFHWQGIEPPPYLYQKRKTAKGTELEERVDISEFEGFVPKTAHEIGLEWHVRHQAAFQENTHLGVSKTINLRKEATKEDVSNAYKMMWESGCKGGTVYRDKSREEQVILNAEDGEVSKKRTKSVWSLSDAALPTQVMRDAEAAMERLKSTSPLDAEAYARGVEERRGLESSNGSGEPSTSPQGVLHGVGSEKRRRLPGRVPTIRQKFRIGNTKGYLHVGMYPDGSPGEVFLTARRGSTLDGFMDAWSVGVSNALQYGTPLENIVRQYEGMRFEPCGPTGCKEVPFCTSIPDFVVRWLKMEFLEGKDVRPTRGTGDFCPDCNTELIRQMNCLMCPRLGCGWSRC